MKEICIRFPKGKPGHELLYYMGVDWYNEKPKSGQKLLDKCEIGKSVILNIKEAQLLKDEVDNALDIKADHLDNEGWNLKQHQCLNDLSSKLYKFIAKEQL